MDFFHSGQKQRNKKRLTEDQVRVLERSFSSSKKLDPDRKLRLAQDLDIPARQVAVWYQNKRARWRTQSLEFDCGTLQLRLDAAAAEKRLLEREVDRLRHELHKAREEAAAAVAAASAASSTPCPGFVVDHAGDQVLQFDDHELFSLIHGCDNDDDVDERLFM